MNRRLGIAAVLFAAAACGGGSGRGVVEAPEPTLAGSTKVESAFAPLRAQWAQRDVDRVRLRSPLERFVMAYPTDPTARLASIYLSFIYMELGDLPRASRLLGSLGSLKPGSTRDLGVVAQARLLRLQGTPELSLDTLRPLVGKIIEPADHEIFLEELALAAIGSHLDYEAVAYMDAWLRGAGQDDRERVRAKIVATIERLPREVLEPLFRTMRARGVQSGYSREIQAMIGDRLGRVAVEQNDAALARWLLDPQAGSTGPAAEGLGELATSRRGLRAVYGRMIGLLLSSGTVAVRDRSADVARGVSFALGLPREPGKSKDEVRLVTRNDGGDVAHAEAALEEMSGEGVGVVIAGVDAASADRALSWCESHGLPVILLYPAAHPPTTRGLVLGDTRAAELQVLSTWLAAQSAKDPALVTDAEGDRALETAALESSEGVSLGFTVSCDTQPLRAGEARFLSRTKQGERPVWLASGTGNCGRDLLTDLLLFGKNGSRLGLALEASAIDFGFARAAGKKVKVTSVRAGKIPVLADSPADAGDAAIAEYMRVYRERPPWWGALGRDAATIAKRALAPLPLDDVNDAAMVTQRRAIVEAGLLATQTDLWTTEARGFDAKRVMKRTYGVVDWPSK
ncbi:MAG: hypothetical protein JNL38_08520 [Myxococcales bacterium]|jgi:hypothetical protein|nr:hypothetical protein [Myxococcales bacterium]